MLRPLPICRLLELLLSTNVGTCMAKSKAMARWVAVGKVAGRRKGRRARRGVDARSQVAAIPLRIPTLVLSTNVGTTLVLSYKYQLFGTNVGTDVGSQAGLFALDTDLSRFFVCDFSSNTLALTPAPAN